MRPNSVPEGNLLISLDTLDAVNAEQGLAFMHALLFQLRQVPEIGPDALIEVVHLSRGTIWAQVAIIVGTLVLGAGAIEVAVEAIRTELEQRDGELARETARTLTIYRGSNCTIVTQHQEFSINIQAMPARRIIDGEPPAPPEGFAYVRDGSAYIRDGDTFVVEQSNGRPKSQQSRTKSADLYTNIPADEVAERTGQVVSINGDLRFVQPDGTHGRIDNISADAPPPREVPIVAMVSATRGEQGGYADRGVKIHGWRLLEAGPRGSLRMPQTPDLQPIEEVEALDLDERSDSENARHVSLVGQLDDSFGAHTFEFLSKNGDTYFAEEADNFVDVAALGQDVFIDATLVQTEGGPLLYIHRLRIID